MDISIFFSRYVDISLHIYVYMHARACVSVYIRENKRNADINPSRYVAS
jgi:hypothetical protein